MTATAVALVTRKCVSEKKVTQDTATSTSIPDVKSASELDSGHESGSKSGREPSTQENLSNRTEEKIRNGNVTYAESVSSDGQMSGSSQ